LFYGFYNEDNRYIYKVGKFKITNSGFKKLYKNKCMKTIRSILEKSSFKNIKELHKIRPELESVFENVDSEVEILDEYRIKNTFPIDIFTDEDLDETKLRVFLTQWARKYPWSDKCYYYTHLTDKYIHFYIKIKSEIK